MNVISFSLFVGSFHTTRYSECYCKYAPGSLLSTKILYPEWEIRLYHDGNIPHNIITLSKTLGIKLFDLGTKDSFAKKCLWRVLPLFDLTDGVVLCRDIDSVTLPKDRFAVEQFLSLDGSCHNIVDHEQHNIELMGGLCGINVKNFHTAFPDLTFDTIPNIFFEYTTPGADQAFLCKMVYPALKFNSVEHRFVGINKFDTPHIITTVDYNVPCKCLVEKDKINMANSLAQYCGQIGFDIPAVMNFYKQYIPLC
jgi:hypothetical protein